MKAVIYKEQEQTKENVLYKMYIYNNNNEVELELHNGELIQTIQIAQIRKCKLIEIHE